MSSVAAAGGTGWRRSASEWARGKPRCSSAPRLDESGALAAETRALRLDSVSVGALAHPPRGARVNIQGSGSYERGGLMKILPSCFIGTIGRDVSRPEPAGLRLRS